MGFAEGSLLLSAHGLVSVGVLALLPLGAPVTAACLTAEANPVLRRVGAVALACVTLLTSASQIRASMGNPEIGATRLTAARKVEDTGLTLGYATFWNANVLTELTDGRVEVVSIGIDPNGAGQGVPTLNEWLESEENAGENRPDEPVFLLLTAREREALSDFLALCGGEEEALADGSVLARVSSQRAFFDAMRALAAR